MCKYTSYTVHNKVNAIHVHVHSSVIIMSLWIASTIFISISPYHNISSYDFKYQWLLCSPSLSKSNQSCECNHLLASFVWVVVILFHRPECVVDHPVMRLISSDGQYHIIHGGFGLKNTRTENVFNYFENFII